MNKMQMQVAEFHSYYSVPMLSSPGIPREDRVALRVSLILEEFKEFATACGYDIVWLADQYQRSSRTADLVEVADALADLLYVVFGSALEFGLDMEPIMDEVQRSNLSKLGEDGKPIYAENGKVLKGPHFSPPDIAQVISLLRQRRLQPWQK